MNEFKKGLKDGLPICLGYISVSFAFGLAATAGGLSKLYTLLISMTNLTSAGQFAGIEIIRENGGLFELAFATLIINLRYLLMSLSLSQKVDPKISTPKRLVMSFGVTDEIFALSMQKQGKVGFKYFFGLMTLPFLGWSGGTFLGAFAGDILPDGIRLALGMAIYAMFIAIIVPPAKKSRNVLYVILIAVLVSSFISLTPVLSAISAGWRIIISTLVAAGTGAILYPETEEAEK